MNCLICLRFTAIPVHKVNCKIHLIQLKPPAEVIYVNCRFNSSARMRVKRSFDCLLITRTNFTQSNVANYLLEMLFEIRISQNANIGLFIFYVNLYIFNKEIIF